MWIGLADLLLCILSVVIVAVGPTRAKGRRTQAEGGILITAAGQSPSISTSTFGSSGRRRSLSFMDRARPAAYRSIAIVSAFRHRRSRSPTGLRRSRNRTKKQRPFGASQPAIMTPASTSIPNANSRRARSRSRFASKSPASIRKGRRCCRKRRPRSGRADPQCRELRSHL